VVDVAMGLYLIPIFRFRSRGLGGVLRTLPVDPLHPSLFCCGSVSSGIPGKDHTMFMIAVKAGIPFGAKTSRRSAVNSRVRVTRPWGGWVTGAHLESDEFKMGCRHDLFVSKDLDERDYRG